ncbi:MAG: tetratricopeptide repeat protein, partial [Anaerolineales bacterium]|nr:tetratricopeptide repeat protein [Anaerolineales bacterium]
RAKLHGGLGDVYNALGDMGQAIAAYQKAIALDPDDAYSRGSLAGVYRKLGRMAEYEEQITVARQLMADENKYNRACFESICGNADEALVLLRAALNLGQVEKKWVAHDPDFDFIREDPRFRELLDAFP